MTRKSSCSKNRVVLLGLLVAWIRAIATLTPGTLNDEAASSAKTTNHDMTNVLGGEWSTLLEFYQNRIMANLMPPPGSTYNIPSMEVLRDMELIVRQMMSLQGREGDLYDSSARQECSKIDLLSLREIYEIGIFEDVELDHIYCVLVTTSIEFPWGMVVVHLSSDGTTIKNLSIDCPHPLHDRSTGELSVAVFRGTNARSLVISGAYRYASNLTSCQGGSFRISDAAHSNQHGFHAAVTAIWKHYHDKAHNDSSNGTYGEDVPMDFMSIQFHGMGSSTCEGVDAYVTHGTKTSLPAVNEISNERDQQLIIVARNMERYFSQIRNQYLFLTPATVGKLGGSPSCSMSGSTNLQGRLWNGVPRDQVCTRAANSTSGRFLHLELKTWMRDHQLFPVWINVLNEVYNEILLRRLKPPVTTSVPPYIEETTTSSLHVEGGIVG